MLETNYKPASVESGRIINVNVDDWSVDVVSEHANKKFLDLQVMSPYFHFAGGEGIYVMPEVGALVWVCIPSSGQFAPPFILGYQAPFQESLSNFRSGRQNMSPGDLMFRTRDGNFIALRRGGVVQIGSTSVAQRMYLPIRNFIKDFCENYSLSCFGGELTWLTDRDDQTITGDAPTTFKLLAKSKANEPAHVASLTVGSHGEGSTTTLELTIFESGEVGAPVKMSLTLGSDGSVLWDVKSTWTTNVVGNCTLTSQQGDINFTTLAGNIALTSAAALSLTAGGAYSLAAQSCSETYPGSKIVDSPEIRLGGVDSTEHAIRGDALVEFLTDLITAIGKIAQTDPPATPTTATEIPIEFAGRLSGLISQKVFVD